MAFVNYGTGLTIPNVGDLGTAYASELSTIVNVLGNLTHTGPANGDGYQLSQLALDFTGDLPFNSFNATNLRSTRFVNQTGVLVGADDLNCVYVDGGNLYFNNASG